MPELPEIVNRSRELNAALAGRQIVSCDVLQPKVLNVTPDIFSQSIVGSRILGARSRGKWIFAELSGGWLLVNLGMGGDLRLTPVGELPAKRRLTIGLDSDEALSFHFWWFGYVHYVSAGMLPHHTMTASLGPEALALSPADLTALAAGRRGPIKSLLLDQDRLAGIGNFYIHDILWLAGLHPLRPAGSLTAAELGRLHEAIRQGLEPSLNKGGAWYETDLQGRPGGFVREELRVAYREGEPCPKCGTPVEKLKTGSTSSFICPACQPVESPK